MLIDFNRTEWPLRISFKTNMNVCLHENKYLNVQCARTVCKCSVCCCMRGAYRKLAFASILFPVKQNPLGKQKVCFRKQNVKKVKKMTHY